MADSKFLPEEVVVEIVSKLPLKSQLRFRCVSKSWHGMISDPEFALSNRKPRQRIALNHWIGRAPARRIKELTLFRFVGRGNGRRSRFLVDNRWRRNEPQLRDLASQATIIMTFKGLLLVREGKAIYVINPMIRRFKKVFTQDVGTRVIGICCDSSRVFTDDYKILLLVKCELTGKDVVRVGSFKTNTLKDVPFPYPPRIYSYDVLFVHERIHLFFNCGTFGDGDPPPLLISFDAAKDEFVDVPFPVLVPKDLRYEKGGHIGGFGVLNGNLAMSLSPWDSQVADIWILKGHGANKSWTILFTLKSKCIGSDGLKPLGFTGDGELLFETAGRLMLYNPKNNSYRNALATPLYAMLPNVVTFEGNVFFPSHLTEFKLSKKTHGKGKRSPTRRNMRSERLWGEFR